MKTFEFKNGVTLVEYEENKLGIFSSFGLSTDIVASEYSAMISNTESGEQFVFMIKGESVYTNVTIVCDSLPELESIANIFSVELKDCRL